ncbi:hypothetical protein TTHERM_00148810 (macronuclear) [Tetrahymena thermophila SB210]|uniref:Uncharacterized protein n=1 Tax=Tetrahymena thermophila (strain SB210) TaxID=312017 RepID=I7ML67_TETTS|nr:hypothetical protein TTHERM_00148810 [Tetrahymena thermophila SB210]EAS01271.1 hypothetical protein TTHERM_00148810 [Tetrahymena thermophila SB210]|eukprot:XP_001021516.1 hypothetical protein TTHERM_00148810 [Tetrahymena thermophila SB210]
MKKNILEEIKDTDNKIKKVFDDIIEQRKRTSQLLQTSYEQLKTSSFNQNTSKQSLNISREATLEGMKNDESRDIKLTDYSPDINIKNKQIFTQDNDEQLFTQEDDLNQHNQDKKFQNKLNISQDTEDLLKSQDDLDLEFPTSLRQLSLNQNQLGFQNNNKNNTQGITKAYNNQFSQNSLRTSVESLNDDSLLSSLHNNSIFNGSQINQNSDNFQNRNGNESKLNSISTQIQNQQKKQNISNYIKIREKEIDFGKQFIFEETQKSLEILNSSDRVISIRLCLESQNFEIDNNYLIIPEFSTVKVVIKCYREEEQRIFDTLFIQEADDQQNQIITANNQIALILKAQILKPQLILKSDQNMQIQGQFTAIEAKINELGELNIQLTNPLTELAQDIEVDVVQKQNDSTKITFFPQNFILKQQETKKISFTISQKNNQMQSEQVFCVFFKINSSPIIFATKIIYS